MGDRIRSFRDLRVYQEAFRLQQEVFEVSKGKYVSEEEHASLMNQCKQIGRMLGKMMANPGPFCRSYTAAKKDKG